MQSIESGLGMFYFATWMPRRGRNLEAPEGTGGRKAEAFENAGKESRKAAHGSKERAAAFFDILTPPTAGE